jgi:hypothetical protein
MADKPIFLYAAVYDDVADAEADYEAVFGSTPPARSAPSTRP